MHIFLEIKQIINTPLILPAKFEVHTLKYIMKVM